MAALCVGRTGGSFRDEYTFFMEKKSKVFNPDKLGLDQVWILAVKS